MYDEHRAFTSTVNSALTRILTMLLCIPDVGQLHEY